MILDEFTGRNCKRTEYIDANGKHWVVRTDPIFENRKLVCYETVLLLQLDYCTKRHGLVTSATKERALMKHDGFIARLQREDATRGDSLNLLTGDLKRRSHERK